MADANSKLHQLWHSLLTEIQFCFSQTHLHEEWLAQAGQIQLLHAWPSYEGTGCWTLPEFQVILTGAV